MGICLDTEQSDGSQAFEEGRETWGNNNSARDQRNALVTPPDGRFPMHNKSPVSFEAPKVPVIFVLGGPGSGKVTHCDNLMQEKKGITHINMTDLLQQYAVGNDMQDFGMLSSKTVTEVLMLEMKMAPNAKTYLVSGYPRNMRDVVEYSEKIQVVNGVILISWRQKVLERQIDYGAKLGQVVLSLARMELNNFYKNVMPVADYFDQSNMLISVNGERHPGDVYKDFRASVFRILGMQDNPPIFSNGRVASVPSVDDVTTELPTMPANGNGMPTLRPALAAPERMVIQPPPATLPTSVPSPPAQLISVTSSAMMDDKQPPPSYQSQVATPRTLGGGVASGWPSVLWVIGGPGSNKAALCTQAAKDTGWTHISLGRLLRAAAEPPNPKPGSDAAKIRDCISGGEMVPLDIVMRVLESHMAVNVNTARGIILDGFPRDMTQATQFEAKYKQKSTIILLDCSKLQLGRGRLDDSVTAFRRRLEIFRQSSLPMLKAMDNIGRLTIVDGDTDTAPVQEDFNSVVKEHIEYITDSASDANGGGGGVQNGRPLPNGIPMPITNNTPSPARPTTATRLDSTMTLLDMESEPPHAAINTISKNVQAYNNNVRNGAANHASNNGTVKAVGIGNGYQQVQNNNNKYTNNHNNNNRQMYGGEVMTNGHM